MSGPIIRKYGFPNFEKIFGEREIKHGGEDEASAIVPPVEPPKEEAKTEAPASKPGSSRAE